MALCPRCRYRLPQPLTKLCLRCALPIPCDPCPAAKASFDVAYAVFEYEGDIRRLIKRFKHTGNYRVAELAAEYLHQGLDHSVIDGSVIIPVPSNPSNYFKRGFEPAVRIAKALAARSGLQVSNCLTRRRSSSENLGSTRIQRTDTNRLQIAVRGRAPAKALLIDDVHTTGATFEASSKALKTAGCESVICASFARTFLSRIDENSV